MKSKLYAAINEWRTGVHQPTEFSTDAYIDAYNGHVGTLTHLRTERTSAFHVMMSDLYNLARCLSQMQSFIMITANKLLQCDGWRLISISNR